SWADDFTLRFQPFRLARGATYELEVDGRSLEGIPLTGERVWGFTTVAPPPMTMNPGSGVARVPILIYHYIRHNPDARDRLGFELSVTPPDFVAQMDWLPANRGPTSTLRGLHP